MSVIEIRNLSFTYEGSSEPVFDGVSFRVEFYSIPETGNDNEKEKRGFPPLNGRCRLR